jgi:dethiobiotin synthetase
VSEDLLFIERFTEQKLDLDLHCPIRLLKPLAPLAASELENKPINLDRLWDSFNQLKKTYSALVVEGIGGVKVPLKNDYLVLDMIADMALPALVVCRPTLGTINHSLLTLDALKNRGIPITGFLTNGHREQNDEAATTSPDLIARFSRVTYLGHIPHYDLRHSDAHSFVRDSAGFLADLGL